MIDRREQILARLITIAGTVSGVDFVFRNKDEINETERPCVRIYDGDETLSDKTPLAEHKGAVQTMLTMTPLVAIELGGKPDSIGTELNTLRLRLIKAVLTDAQLVEMVAKKGRYRYEGCTVTSATARQTEAAMILTFSFTYSLNPSEL
jgi:hypothetical protein